MLKRSNKRPMPVVPAIAIHRWLPLLGVLILLAVLLPAAAVAAPVWPPGDPCLSGDPFDLDQLIEIMSRAQPPTAPIQLNADLSLVYAGVGDMIAGGEDELEPGPRPPANPNPSEPAPAVTHYTTATVRAFNTANYHMFDITMSEAMLRRIHDCHEQTGRTSADGGQAGIGPREGRWSFLPLVDDGPRTGPATPPTAGATASIPASSARRRRSGRGARSPSKVGLVTTNRAARRR